MYRRFLNNDDYLSIITPEALSQLIRSKEERLIQAEQNAEISIIEYLSENYEIEQELNKGKYIAEYNRSISYPIGAYIYFEDKIYETIRPISGYKVPAIIDYWEEYSELITESIDVKRYSQFGTFYPGDIVVHNDFHYLCLSENGYKFNDIRIPLVNGWLEADYSEWQPVEYDIWDLVAYNNSFYTLLSTENFDNNIAPADSDNWGEIAEYTSDHNEYELTGHDYVVYKGRVFIPEIDVNSDKPEIGKNLIPGDPRNFNLKKHMVRITIYELTKLIAPNNVSIVRLKDYEESMKWLNDVSKLKRNPQIPRKLAEDKKPVTDWQMATFQTDYNPYNNPWLV